MVKNKSRRRTLKNLTLNDTTQKEILGHLAITETLLAKVGTKLSGAKRDAEIYGLPDLGFPSNVRRAHGGFYTGAFYTWETDVPFVPVDATLNCCGVSLWRLNDEIPDNGYFLKRISASHQAMKATPYQWNYRSGNHFITYGKIVHSKTISEGPYLAIHSSTAEYKKQPWGLYPQPGNWYDSAMTVEQDTNSNRYLRYISGSIAESFIALTKELEEFNRYRHRWLAEHMAREIGIADEILNIQHYGMPNPHSIAIGCQWEKTPYLLLTAPKCPLYLVDPLQGGENVHADLTLTPHGLGMRSVEPPKITYTDEGLKVNEVFFGFNHAMRGAPEMELRAFPTLLKEVFQKCPGNILATFLPKFSYCN